MREFRCWVIVGGFCLRYLFFRLKIARRPTVLGKYQEASTVFGRVLRLHKRLHIRGAEHLPTDCPAIFYGNHAQIDDPFTMFCAISRVRGFAPQLGVMMRDDFFTLPRPIDRFLAMEELFKCLGVYAITRGKVSLAQMRPFLDYLAQEVSFLMYPGGTRTRSGLFMEYRDLDHEPGAVSFFIHHTQRRIENARIPAVPVGRTIDPVTKRTAMIFGEAQYLKKDASRSAQRDFDTQLVEVLALLVELNVPMVLSAILYARCLHGLTGPISQNDLERSAAAVFEGTDHPFLAPDCWEGLGEACRGTLAYLEQRGTLRRNAGMVEPDAARILSVPPLDTSYHKRNPVKYLTNQLLHLGGVIRLIEEHGLTP